MKGIPEHKDPERIIETDFLDSEFVEIRSEDGIFDVEMKYPLLHMENAEEQCLVRREVYEQLLVVAEKLAPKFKIRIWDAWRPFALQKELYLDYSEDIIREFKLQNWPLKEKKSFIRKYVSDPTADRDVPPVHTTGGAVDVTLLDSTGSELEMGSAFDEFTDRTKTSYYEKNGDTLIRHNRRILYNAMTEAGFTNLPSEWWHFDYWDRYWAYYMGKKAKYKGVFTKGEMEDERR